MKSFRVLAVSAATLAFLLAILGSWVRINGAGMTCPDWPLCKGAIVPTLEGGVIYEWSHRFIALLEGFVLLGAVVSGWRVRKQIKGVERIVAILGGVFAIQVLLGGITVKLSNRPDSVVYHWAAAMALIATLAVFATLAVLQPRHELRMNLRTAMLATAAGTCVLAMCAGAFVSSSGAGLACSALPGCSQLGFWGVGILEHAQMVHRLCAAIFFVAACVATLGALQGSRRVLIAAMVAAVLLVLQITLGIANVIYALPIGLREAHAANAAATFVAYVIAATLASLDAGAAGESAPERSLNALHGVTG